MTLWQSPATSQGAAFGFLNDFMLDCEDEELRAVDGPLRTKQTDLRKLFFGMNKIKLLKNHL